MSHLIQMETKERNLQHSPYDVDISGNVIVGEHKHESAEALMVDVPVEMLPEIAKELGKTYLADAHIPPGGSWPVHGILYGISYRPMICCPVRTRVTSIWVVFLVDTGAPFTTLSFKVMQMLVGDGGMMPSALKVNINGVTMNVRASKDHYEHIHLMGADFLSHAHALLDCDYRQSKVSITYQEEEDI